MPIALSQKSTLSDALLKKDWLITQFGQTEIAGRLWDVLSKLSFKEYNRILFFLNKQIHSNEIRKILINNGLKPVV